MESNESGSVLVTGAAGALGTAVVARFLAGGDRVVAVDRDLSSLESLTRRLGSSSSGLSTRVADLGSTSDVASLFAADEGRPRVVHLVGGFAFAPLAECDDEQWARLVQINLDTTFRILRQCGRAFAAAGGGSVVAVSSPAAITATAGMGPYAAVKAGVLRLIEALAREAQPYGGRANAVLPGTMDTPANRGAMPDADPAGWVSTAAVADVIHFLASDAAAAINGAAVPVPGPTLA